MSRITRDRIPADEEYNNNEGVRTLVNAINMLHASASDDYTFWSAFYKFAVDNNHRVSTETNYQAMYAAYKREHAERVAKAAQTISEMNHQAIDPVNLGKFVKAALAGVKSNRKK